MPFVRVFDRLDRGWADLGELNGEGLGTAAGKYDVRRLQFKLCAELDEAARLRLTVAGDIREHPRKRPDRWVRAGITFMHPDGLSVNFGYR